MNTYKIDKKYVAPTLRIMNYLAKKFDVVKVQPDRNNPKSQVFIFEDSQELRNYLAKYNNGLNTSIGT